MVKVLFAFQRLRKINVMSDWRHTTNEAMDDRQHGHGVLGRYGEGAQRRRSTASRLGGCARRIYLVGPHQLPSLAPRLYERCRCYLNVCPPSPRVCAGYGAATLVAITGVAGREREAAMGSSVAVRPSPKSAAAGSRWLKRFHNLFLSCVFCCFVVVVYACARCSCCWCCCR